MGFWHNIAGRLDLMTSMFSRTGMAIGSEVNDCEASKMRNAMFRCLGCRDAETCKHWLAEAGQGSAAPEFCANADYINSVSHESA